AFSSARGAALRLAALRTSSSGCRANKDSLARVHSEQRHTQQLAAVAAARECHRVFRDQARNLREQHRNIWSLRGTRNMRAHLIRADSGEWRDRAIRVLS